MLADEIKARMFRAMKAGRSVEKEILRVALGEISTDAARPGRLGNDEEAAGHIRKLIKSNEESLTQVTDAAQRETLVQELEVLASLLPKNLDEDEVVAALAPVREAIVAAPNDGAATGVAMKQLKAIAAVVNGKVVSAAVKRLRSGA